MLPCFFQDIFSWGWEGVVDSKKMTSLLDKAEFNPNNCLKGDNSQH